MKKLLLFLVVVLIFQYIESLCKNIQTDCVNKQYTDSEVKEAMEYLQKRFAVTLPHREKCKTFYVIRNIKYMDRQSIDAYINAVKELKNLNNAYCQFIKNHPENVTSK